MVRALFAEFKESFFTAADLLTRADSSMDLLSALCEYVGPDEIDAQRLGYQLARLDRARFGALEMRGHFSGGTWRYQVVEHVPLTEAQKADLRALTVAEPHETPAGVKALKRLGKAIDKAEVKRAQAEENFEKLEHKIATINQISVETVHMMKDEAWPEEDPFAPPPTPQEIVVRDSQPLVEAVEDLTVPQREFLECLVESRYDTVRARERYRDTFGRTLPNAELQLWMTEEKFVRAVQVRETIAAKLHGVSVASVYADLADIKRRNIGVNDRLALTAIEMLSKALGMFKPDENKSPAQVGPGLFIRLTSKDGTEIAIAAGTDRVAPNLAGPSDDSRLINP